MQFHLLHMPISPSHSTSHSSFLALSSLHLVGFESSLINFTCPHFCPQLFIGPYYENLNLLFDYWLLPLEACGFWCIIEQSWSHKWLLHTRIKVWVYWMSNHLAEESFSSVSQYDLYSPRETWSPVIFQSNWCTVWSKKLQLCTVATLHFFSSVRLHSQQVCFISLWNH